MVFLLFSGSQSEFSRVTVDYITLPGWKESTGGLRKFQDLPQNAQNYVNKIQELLGVPGQ